MGGVDIRIDGGAEWRASGWSLKQQSTPVDPSDSFGGVGEFSFEIPAGVDPKLIDGLPVEVVDSQETTRGVIHAVGLVNNRLTATCTTRLLPFVCERSAAPNGGMLEPCTIESYLTYVFGLCGVTTGIVFDPSIADTTVVALGWSGDVWRQIKQFCLAYEVEVAVVDTDIVVRPLRTERARRGKEESFQWSKDRTGLARRVESWYYPTTEVTDALIVGRRHDIGTQFLAAGETDVTTLELDYSLSSVDQPVCMDSVSYGSGGSSVYAVVDRWGERVKASYWRDLGGDVSVEIGEDSRSVTITITACLDLSRAPYRLVGKRKLDGEDVEYPTLRVVGSGLAFKRKFYSMHACTDGSATVEVGCEVDNDFITSFEQCHRLLLWAAVRFGTPTIRVSGSAVLGAGAGARLLDDYAEYRVRSVTRGPSGLAGYEAEWDTILDDLAYWETKTLDEFTAGHTTINAFNVRPLTT